MMTRSPSNSLRTMKCAVGVVVRGDTRTIDGNGLSESDFDADPDFKEAYFAGAYDVPCEVCGGRRVEAVVDVESLSAENKVHWEKYQRHLDAEHRMRLEHLAEIRFGA